MANKEVVWLPIALTLTECEIMANHTAVQRCNDNLQLVWLSSKSSSEVVTEQASWQVCELRKKKGFSFANSEKISDLEEKQI